MPSPVVEKLKSISGPIASFQKICDAEDWIDERLRIVAREVFGLKPRLSPRMWEFVVAYLALAKAGKLDGDSTGLTFGSGREPLIFAAARESARLVATDLYTADTRWAVAQTESPRDYVMTAAPKGFDASNLEVRSMDMRRIEFPDASFDYCYSISAFEHIGDDPDFLDHLREVRRVLKPGGIYVLTTEVRLAPESHPSRGNYSFALQHLLRLFQEAGLHPEPRVDMRQSDMLENDPRDLALTRLYDPGDGYMMSFTVREYGGIMSTPVVFLLRREDQGPTEVVGLQDTIKRCDAALALRNRARFSDWIRLNPWGYSYSPRNPFLDLYASKQDPDPDADHRIVFNTGYNAFGTDLIEYQLVMTPSPEADEPFQIHLAVNEWERDGARNIQARFRQAMTVNDPPGKAAVLRFQLPTKASCRYALFGLRGTGRPLLAAVDVQVRRAPKG